MKHDIFNAIGTLATIVALVFLIILANTFSSGSVLLMILSGVGIVHTLLSHDEFVRLNAKKEKPEKKPKAEDEEIL